MRFALLLTVAILLSHTSVCDADGGGKRRLRRWLLTPPKPVRTDYHKRNPYYSRTDPYPKFYGGFHSRHFTDLGIPTGDRGLRGNGVYWTPW